MSSVEEEGVGDGGTQVGEGPKERLVQCVYVCVGGWGGPGPPPEANSYSLFGMLWGREFPSLT